MQIANVIILPSIKSIPTLGPETDCDDNVRPMAERIIPESVRQAMRRDAGRRISRSTLVGWLGRASKPTSKPTTTAPTTTRPTSQAIDRILMEGARRAI